MREAMSLSHRIEIEGMLSRRLPPPFVRRICGAFFATLEPERQ